MFKRHRTSKFAMIAYLIWWLFFFTAVCSSSDNVDRIGLTKMGGTLVFVYFITLIIKIITSDAANRKDFSKMLVLVILPVVLPILAFIIYLLFGGKILTKLW